MGVAVSRGFKVRSGEIVLGSVSSFEFTSETQTEGKQRKKCKSLLVRTKH